ncbi:protein of unknown function [Magnetospira sp. QH-2]|nr:protein of unknown function [Magnetospira sp. QH-2]
MESIIFDRLNLLFWLGLIASLSIYVAFNAYIANFSLQKFLCKLYFAIYKADHCDEAGR